MSESSVIESFVGASSPAPLQKKEITDCDRAEVATVTGTWTASSQASG